MPPIGRGGIALCPLNMRSKPPPGVGVAGVVVVRHGQIFQSHSHNSGCGGSAVAKGTHFFRHVFFAKYYHAIRDGSQHFGDPIVFVRVAGILVRDAKVGRDNAGRDNIWWCIRSIVMRWNLIDSTRYMRVIVFRRIQGQVGWPRRKRCCITLLILLEKLLGGQNNFE